MKYKKPLNGHGWNRVTADFNIPIVKHRKESNCLPKFEGFINFHNFIQKNYS